MEIPTAIATNIVSELGENIFLQTKRGISYVVHYKRRVEIFEEKVKTLKERRERVQREVDAAERNLEPIHSDVKSWLIKADKMIDEEVRKVEDLEDKAKNRKMAFKSRYQLSKKAEEAGKAVDELLQQGHFDKVSYRDLPRPVADAPPKGLEAFDSRKKVLEKIMEALKDPKVNIIGVYGMAGVGKTTLVKEIARQVEADKSFHRVVMAAVTHSPKIHEIQDQIAELLGLKLEEKSVAVRAARLHERLKQEKKILVVLDDVWKRLDLKEVGIPFAEEHKGCTLLLSSRDNHVLLNEMDAQQSFRIGILNEDEGWGLFKKLAENNFDNPELQSTAMEIAKKCVGLPIALATVARALRRKQLFEWKDALQRLQRPSSINLKEGILKAANSAIEFSYNQLESEELKQTFLLCSLLGHNAPIRDLLIYAMGMGLFHGVSRVEETRNRLLTMVSHLKDSCLLIDSYTDQLFDMHDLISDVAKSIASKDNHVFALKNEEDLDDWPDGETMKYWDRVCLSHAKVIKLPALLQCPNLTLFYMHSKDPLIEIPSNFFEETKNLKVLDLTGLHLTSLPSSICQLQDHLQTLCLDNCVLEDISIIGQLKNLKILSLGGSDIERLPKEIGQLKKLKLLDLNFCTRLKVIPPGVLSSLSRLEELLMANSFVQWETEGNASLAEFKAFSASLTSLQVHIPDAKIIPEDFFFEKLERYKILIGEAWVWSIAELLLEQSKTLKLELHTSIGCLNEGIKMLLSKAENVYINIMTAGVQILLHGVEDWKHFQQLKNLHIQNGASLEYIIKDNCVIDKIEFPQLKSVTLQDLPNFNSFCSKNNGSTCISPQELPLFNEKHVNATFSFPRLEILRIEQCPELKGFFNNSTSRVLTTAGSETEVVLFNEEVAFPNLEGLRISNLRNVKWIWYDQLHADSFGKLKGLVVEYCDELRSLFPSFVLVLGVFQSLEVLKVSDCNSLEQVFDIKETCIATMQLRELYLIQLPKLKHIWNCMDPDPNTISFQNLRDIQVRKCCSLKSVFPFSIAKGLPQLESLDVSYSGVEEIVSKNSERLERGITQFEFNQLSSLDLFILPELKCFYPEMHTIAWRALKWLKIDACKKIKKFGVGQMESQIPRPLFHIDEIIPQLEEVSFTSDEVSMICDEGNHAADLFSRIKVLCLTSFEEESTVFPFHFLQRFYNLETLQVIFCFFKELSLNRGDDDEEINVIFTLPKIKHLKLYLLPNITHLWNEDSPLHHICASLETLEVWGCPNLCNLGSSFQNLTTLDVYDCNGMAELITSSEAQSLMCLVTMKIRECEMMAQVILARDEAVNHEINFRKLKSLELHCLPSLESFCSAVHCTFNFPSLEQVIVRQCPSLKTFCHGNSLSTPKLQRAQLKQTDSEAKERWAGDLNATIQQLYIQQAIPQLEEVSFSSDDIAMICNAQFADDFFCHIKVLTVTSYLTESPDFPFGFLQRFYNLESLNVYDSNFKELSAYDDGEEKQVWTLPKVKKLLLNRLYEIEHLWDWEEDSPMGQICANLQTLVVWNCHSLISLGSSSSSASFQNLTFLDVWRCNGIADLITSSKAQSLDRLEVMRISECEMMKQVIASDDEEATYSEIIFTDLKLLILDCLQSLESFSSGSYSFKFPSLLQVNVSECPSLKSFCQGALSTPNLDKVETDSEGRWAGDLNTTIQQLYIEQNDVHLLEEEN